MVCGGTLGVAGQRVSAAGCRGQSFSANRAVLGRPAACALRWAAAELVVALAAAAAPVLQVL